MEQCRRLCASAPKDVLCVKTTHTAGYMLSVNLVRVKVLKSVFCHF